MATKTLSPAGRQKKKYNQSGKKKQNPVGRFYEKLVETLVGGVSTRDLYLQGIDEKGDVYHPRLGFNVEVKAGNNRNSMLINLEQKTEHQRWRRRVKPPGTPFLYGLCRYYNQGTHPMNHPDPRLRGQKMSFTAQAKSEAELHSILADKMRCLYLIDVAVLSHLIEILGTSSKNYPGRESENKPTLKIDQGDFSIFSGSTESVLTELGFSTRAWSYSCSKHTVRMPHEFNSVVATFPVITVLPTRWHSTIMEEIEFVENLPF